MYGLLHLAAQPRNLLVSRFEHYRILRNFRKRTSKAYENSNEVTGPSRQITNISWDVTIVIQTSGFLADVGNLGWDTILTPPNMLFHVRKRVLSILKQKQ